MDIDHEAGLAPAHPAEGDLSGADMVSPSTKPILHVEVPDPERRQTLLFFFSLPFPSPRCHKSSGHIPQPADSHQEIGITTPGKSGPAHRTDRRDHFLHERLLVGCAEREISGTPGILGLRDLPVASPDVHLRRVSSYTVCQAVSRCLAARLYALCVHCLTVEEPGSEICLAG